MSDREELEEKYEDAQEEADEYACELLELRDDLNRVVDDLARAHDALKTLMGITNELVGRRKYSEVESKAIQEAKEILGIV